MWTRNPLEDWNRRIPLFEEEGEMEEEEEDDEDSDVDVDVGDVDWCIRRDEVYSDSIVSSSEDEN